MTWSNTDKSGGKAYNFGPKSPGNDHLAKIHGVSVTIATETPYPYSIFAALTA
jgi:hypothetical protein